MQTPTPTPAPSPAPAALTHRTPWYVDHGMLGEAEVTQVAPWDERQATRAARTVVDALAFTADVPASTRTAIRIGVRDMLREWGGDPAHTREQVMDTLLKGRLLVADRRLVWLKPVLADAVPQASRPDGGVRQYGVSFNSTSSQESRTRTVAHSADAVMFTALGVGSAALSAVLLGAPQISADSAGTRTTAGKRNVITGRKLFVSSSKEFRSGVRFRIFVDGREVQPRDGGPAVVRRDIGMSFPADFTTDGETRPDMHQPPQGPLAQDRQRPRRAGEALNAIDLTEPLAQLQQSLRAQHVDARTAHDVVEKAQVMLNERTARNRSRWWLTSGDTAPKIREGHLPGFGAFRGHPRVRMSVENVQFLSVTPVKMRDDMGGGMSAVTGRGGESAAAVSVGFSLAGLVDPDLEQSHGGVGPKGMGPLFSATAAFSRGWDTGITSQALAHTILNSGESHARYRVRLRLEVDWSSRTHPGLGTLVSSVDADLGVPWRDGLGAAEFEQRVLGGVRTDYVRDAARLRAQNAVPQVWPTPPQSQPYVRALLDVAQVDLVQRQAPLRPEPARHPYESEALTSRRGLGYAVAAALPGAEAVEDSFRRRLQQLTGARPGFAGWWDRALGRAPAKGRAAADNQIATFFGRPALEGDLSAVLAGVKQDITYGGRRFELAVRARLDQHLAHRRYRMTVNARAAVAQSVDSGRDTKWALTLGAGAGTRVGLGPLARLQIGGFRLQGKYGRSEGEKFTGTAKTYRRMEDVDDVHEHVYNIVYEQTLRPLDQGPGAAVHRWWTARDGDVVAQVVVPAQHVPAAPPPGPVRHRDIVTALPALPDHGHLDLRGGSSGVYPAFLAMPELAGRAVRLYAELHGLHRQWGADLAAMPKEILNSVRPDQLAAYFGLLTDKWGHTVTLPERDGWKSTMTLRLRVDNARRLPLLGGDTEIEQYSQAVRRYTAERGRTWGLGIQAGLGPQFRFGSEQGHPTEAGDDATGGGGHRGGVPGGRITLAASVGGGKEWTTSQETSDGSIEITRATYGGPKATYRGDAVFEVTVHRQNGKRTEQRTSVLSFRDGVDLLIPDRRTEDIREVPAPVPGPSAGLAPGVPSAARPAPSHTYVGGRLPVTAAHPELLRADDVLDTIEDRLTARGVLPTRRDAQGRPVLDEQHVVVRALRAVYRSEAMKAQTGALFDTGLWTWIPMRGFGGATRYLWVNVTAEHMADAHSHRPRPDVDLTLRGESTGEHKSVAKSSRSLGGGVAVSARGGVHDAVTSQQGHAGADLAAGGLGKVVRGEERLDKEISIYRANTKGGAQEFEHRVDFRIELATTYELPEVLKPLTLPATGLNALTGVVADHFGFEGTLRRVSQHNHRWEWFDGGGRFVPGDIRLIVPTHLTTPLPAGPPPPGHPPVFTRGHGDNPRWTPARTPVGPPSRELLENIHPWDVPAAAAVHRWAKVAAIHTAREPDLAEAGRPWEVPGIDFTTTAGLRYVQQTSHAQLRPHIEALLGHEYEVTVDGRKVTVGFDLSGGTVVTPQVESVRHKARRYRQDDTDEETFAQSSRDVFRGGGPEGGGGGDTTFLGRLPFERTTVNDEKLTTAIAETDEKNKEGTRNFRYFTFDVTVVLTPEHRPGRQLRVDVPGGLVAMFPLAPDGTTLVSDLVRTHPHLFTERLRPIEPSWSSFSAEVSDDVFRILTDDRLLGEDTAHGT
ncbi:hypothetical protein ACFV23_37600 [Streptomyces sp. NPDC059627]